MRMQVENTGICLGYGKDYGDSKMYIYFSYYFYNIIMVCNLSVRLSLSFKLDLMV